MRMMWCVGSQSSVSQMNLLLHGSIWLQTMVSNRSISCRDFESMRINECVVKRRTVQSINKPSYIVHCSFVLFVLSYCALFYSYDPDFLKQWLDSWDDHHHVLRTPYKYDVVCLYAHERTRRTHKMSCGWTNVHDMMRNESYIRTHRISTITRLHAQCSYDENCVATASLLLGIFFGLIFAWGFYELSINTIQYIERWCKAKWNPRKNPRKTDSFQWICRQKVWMFHTTPPNFGSRLWWTWIRKVRLGEGSQVSSTQFWSTIT